MTETKPITMRKIIIAIMLTVPTVCNAQVLRIEVRSDTAKMNYISHGWALGDSSRCKTSIVIKNEFVLTAKCNTLDSMIITGDTIEIIKFLMNNSETESKTLGKAIDVIDLINIKWLTTSDDIEDKEWQKELKKYYEAYRKELYGE